MKKKKGLIVKIIGALIVVGILGNIFGPKEEQKQEANKTTVEATKQTESKNETTKPVEKKEVKPSIPVEYTNALEKAKSYVETMNMSKKGVYGQLTSEYGEKFTKEAAQYAIDNLKADYKAAALAKAKNYQESMKMSPAAIKDQLTSEHGEQFTPEEAQYAIDNLNK